MFKALHWNDLNRKNYKSLQFDMVNNYNTSLVSLTPRKNILLCKQWRI